MVNKESEKIHCNALVYSREAVASKTPEILFYQLILGAEIVLTYYLQIVMIKFIVVLISLCRDLSI